MSINPLNKETRTEGHPTMGKSKKRPLYPYKCKVSGCENPARHILPKNSVQRARWLQAMKVEGEVLGKKQIICNLHFKDTDYLIYDVQQKKIFLKRHAVPSLFPWNDDSSHLSVKKSKYLEKLSSLSDSDSISEKEILPLNTLPSSSSTPLPPTEKKLSYLSSLTDNECLSIDASKIKATYSKRRMYLHEGFMCNECQGRIVKFRYVCVECADYDLCADCEAQMRHAEHLMLRVPPNRSQEEVTSVLASVRNAVTAVLTQRAVLTPREVLTPRDVPTPPPPSQQEDEICIKTEVKEEVEELDPLLPIVPSPTNEEEKFEAWTHNADKPHSSSKGPTVLESVPSSSKTNQGEFKQLTQPAHSKKAPTMTFPKMTKVLTLDPQNVTSSSQHIINPNMVPIPQTGQKMTNIITLPVNPNPASSSQPIITLPVNTNPASSSQPIMTLPENKNPASSNQPKITLPVNTIPALSNQPIKTTPGNPKPASNQPMITISPQDSGFIIQTSGNESGKFGKRKAEEFSSESSSSAQMKKLLIMPASSNSDNLVTGVDPQVVLNTNEKVELVQSDLGKGKKSVFGGKKTSKVVKTSDKSEGQG